MIEHIDNHLNKKGNDLKYLYLALNEMTNVTTLLSCCCLFKESKQSLK